MIVLAVKVLVGGEDKADMFVRGLDLNSIPMGEPWTIIVVPSGIDIEVMNEDGIRNLHKHLGKVIDDSL